MLDRLHGTFAGVGYPALAATPLLAVAPLLALGHRRLARCGLAAVLTSAIALSLAATGPPTELFQRIGLTVSDAWIIASAPAIGGGAIDAFHAR